MLPKAVTEGKIVKHYDENGNSRYDFQFQNKRGFKTTVEGLSYKFDKEYWNYAKLISGVLRHGMPVHQAVELVSTMEFDNENINTWKTASSAPSKIHPQRHRSHRREMRTLRLLRRLSGGLPRLHELRGVQMRLRGRYPIFGTACKGTLSYKRFFFLPINLPTPIYYCIFAPSFKQQWNYITA